MKVLRPTVAAIEAELHRLDADLPPFSYDPASRIAFPLYSGQITLKAALDACQRIKSPLGARCNAEVVEIMWRDAQQASFFCHRLKARLFPIRRDLVIPVWPRFYFVRSDLVRLFWLQPWKVFDLTEEQLGVLASVIKLAFVVDDFEDAQLYLLDTSAAYATAVRRPRVFDFADLPLLSQKTLTAAFDRFALAYDAFVRNRKPRPQRPDRDAGDVLGRLL